jgi:putative transposase
MLQGQKNNCGCRRRRRRAVPDEDRGRGDRRFSRSNLADRLQERCKKRIGRPPLPDDELVSTIKAVIAELPTYGYRRVHAVLKRQALAAGLTPPNHKRVYRVMKVYGLLLDRHGGGDERRHDGRIAVDERNRRWCADGFEIGCDNGEWVRVGLRSTAVIGKP